MYSSIFTTFDLHTNLFLFQCTCEKTGEIIISQYLLFKKIDSFPVFTYILSFNLRENAHTCAYEFPYMLVVSALLIDYSQLYSGVPAPLWDDLLHPAASAVFTLISTEITPLGGVCVACTHTCTWGAGVWVAYMIRTQAYTFSTFLPSRISYARPHAQVYQMQ